MALLFPLGLWADDLVVGDTFTADGVTYKVTSVDPLEVQVGTGDNNQTAIDKSTEGAFVIPTSVTGADGNSYAVTAINAYAFRGCSGLTSVTIPSSVTSLGRNSFENCSGLTSVAIPNSVISIGWSVFSGCSGLTSVTLPNTIDQISLRCFENCINLASIAIPDNVTSIGYYAFYGCSSLSSVVIPNSVTEIGYQAFYDCSSLSSVVIPNSVARINQGAFQNCNSLTSVTVALKEPKEISEDVFTNRANATLYVPDGCADAYKDAEYWKEFKEYKEMDPIIVNPKQSFHVATPGTLNDLIPQAEKYEIEELTLTGELNGGDIVTIRAMAGINLDKMNDYRYLGKSSFTNGKLRVLDLSGARIVEGGRDYYREKVGSVSFTKSYTKTDEISGAMFAFCYKLEEVVLPKSAKVISSSLFHGEATDKPEMNIKVVKVADGNPNYDSRDNCNAVIESATNTFVVGAANSIIPDGVTSIAGYAFYGCSGLTSVTIPNSVTEIGMYAFNGCDGLQSFTVDINDPLVLGNGVFSNFNATLYVPKGCKGAYELADYWKEFKSIEEDETLKGSSLKVGDKFSVKGIRYGVTSVEPLEVQVSGGISAEGMSAEGAAEIPSSVIGTDGNTYSVTSIREFAFQDCYSLTSLVIPNTVRSIGDFAFFYCVSLTSVNIPNSVTSIGIDCFYGCSKLISMTVDIEEPLVVNDITALWHHADAILYVPKGCAEAYRAEENWNHFKEIKEMIKEGSSTFTVENDKSLTVKDYNSSTEKEIVIPASVILDGETCPVTAIGEKAYANNTIMEQVTIPETIEKIGDAAFAGCTSLKVIYSYSKEPIPLGSAKAKVRTRADSEEISASTVFAEVDKETCVLYVPSGSADKYKAADGWSEFKNIVEMDSDILGDANNDGKVDVDDIDAIIRYIMEGDDEGFNFKNADVNGDEKINAADIVEVVKIIKANK